MMTERIDIDRLARKCGFAKWCSPDENSWTASHTELAAYTRAVMEACAKACWPDPLQDSISPYMQGRIDCRDVIEEMMP